MITELSSRTGARAASTGSAGGDELLRLEDISLAFGGVAAVTHIGFSMRRQEILSIIGPNGAGKSSLLNIVNGVYRPQAGRIFLDGELIARIEPRRAARLGIARTFQNLAMFKGMSVIDNVMTGRDLHARGTFIGHALRTPGAVREEKAQRRRADALLESLDLGRYRDAPVGKLPYGLQKRVELARALAAEPRLLLLDEPMAGMNLDEKHEMARFIVDANRRLGISVLLIEHDMGVVMDLSDRVVVLDYGRKIADGPPAAVRNDPAVVAAYLGTAH